MSSSEEEVFSRDCTLSPRTDSVHSRRGDIATTQFGQKQLDGLSLRQGLPWWMIFLLASVTNYLAPALEIVLIHDELIPSAGKWRTRSFWAKCEPVVQVLFTLGFTASTLFYVWASMHSYRFLESYIGLGFYLPKVILLALYVAGKIVILYGKNHMIFTSELPLTNLTGMISLYYSANDWSTELGISWVIAMTVADDIFIGCILYERRRTKSLLQKADYHK